MRDWKKKLSGTRGLMLGSLAAAVILILSLSGLVDYLQISPSSLPIPMPMAYHNELSDHGVMAYQPSV